MKLHTMIAAGLALSTLAGTAAADCTFRWQHYGATQTYKLVSQGIGTKVTDAYCAKYNKDYEIVIITDEYNNSTSTLAHVSVGLRKRGSKELPANRYSAYRSENGNFVVGKKYEMSAALALDTVMDVMSSPDDFTN